MRILRKPTCNVANVAQGTRDQQFLRHLYEKITRNTDNTMATFAVAGHQLNMNQSVACPNQDDSSSSTDEELDGFGHALGKNQSKERLRSILGAYLVAWHTRQWSSFSVGQRRLRVFSRQTPNNQTLNKAVRKTRSETVRRQSNILDQKRFTSRCSGRPP